jgi:quinolinate synthase
MFEERVLELLRKYLGAYVTLDREALRISVWKGECVS